MRRHWLLLVGFCVFLGLASPAQAECRLPAVPLTPDGYFTGQNLLAADDEALATYLAGYINGMTFAVVLGASEECVRQANTCLATLKAGDMVRAVRGYIAADPRRLAQLASTLTFNALFGPCFGTEYGEDPPPIQRPTPS